MVRSGESMGVTIYANGVDRSFDCGYIGFAHLRNRICEVYDKDLYNVYSDMKMCALYTSEWTEKINEICNLKHFPDEDEDILDFFFASDCAGKISYKTCGKIYYLIKDVDFGERIFTYAAHSDGKDYERLKEFLHECYRKRACMRWD